MSRRKPSESGQYGRFSRLTEDEIATVRGVYASYNYLLRKRTQICHDLGITPDYFCKVGRGAAGKKPRVQA